MLAFFLHYLAVLLIDESSTREKGGRVKSRKERRKMDVVFCIRDTTWFPVPYLRKEKRIPKELSPQKRGRLTSVDAESF